MYSYPSAKEVKGEMNSSSIGRGGRGGDGLVPPSSKDVEDKMYSYIHRQRRMRTR